MDHGCTSKVDIIPNTLGIVDDGGGVEVDKLYGVSEKTRQQNFPRLAASSSTSAAVIELCCGLDIMEDVVLPLGIDGS